MHGIVAAQQRTRYSAKIEFSYGDCGEFRSVNVRNTGNTKALVTVEYGTTGERSRWFRAYLAPNEARMVSRCDRKRGVLPASVFDFFRASAGPPIVDVSMQSLKNGLTMVDSDDRVVRVVQLEQGSLIYVLGFFENTDSGKTVRSYRQVRVPDTRSGKFGGARVEIEYNRPGSDRSIINSISLVDRGPGTFVRNDYFRLPYLANVQMRVIGLPAALVSINEEREILPKDEVPFVARVDFGVRGFDSKAEYHAQQIAERQQVQRGNRPARSSDNNATTGSASPGQSDERVRAYINFKPYECDRVNQSAYVVNLTSQPLRVTVSISRSHTLERGSSRSSMVYDLQPSEERKIGCDRISSPPGFLVFGYLIEKIEQK